MVRRVTRLRRVDCHRRTITRLGRQRRKNERVTEVLRRERQLLDFAAYAVGRDENDPLTGAINELINHSSDTDKRIAEMQAALEQVSQLLLAQSAQQTPEQRDKKRA